MKNAADEPRFCYQFADYRSPLPFESFLATKGIDGCSILEESSTFYLAPVQI